MARVIVILTLMVAITAAMFAVTRKPAIAPGEAANGPSATVELDKMPAAAPAKTAGEISEGETQSLTAAAPRPQPTSLEPAAAATASTQDVTNGPVAGAAPALGTAGIDNKGNASFTGTATPADVVTLVLDGKPVGSATTDGSGNWEIAFKAKPGKTERELFVSAQGKDGSVVIGPQRATIGPPAAEGSIPRITMKAAEPKAVMPLVGGDATPEPKTGIVVEKVTGGEDGLTMLTGKADPGAVVKAAINGKPAGETRVDADGAWSLAAANPSRKAANSLRLELVDKDGATLDRTDVPYKVPAVSPKLASKDSKVRSDFPAVLTSTPKGKDKKPENEDLAELFAPKASADASEVAPKVIRVRRGDSLWRIAKRHLGKGRKWAAFYKANKTKIDNPDLIYPGQTLVIPG